MKKIVYIFICLLFFANAINAKELGYTQKQLEYQQELKNLKYSFSYNDFSTVVYDGNYDIAEKFVKAGINTKKPSLLCFAIEKQHNDIVELLLKNGANPNESYCGMRHIITAIDKNNIQAIEILINYNVDLNLKSFGMTPYEYAITKKKYEIAEFINKENSLEYQYNNASLLSFNKRFKKVENSINNYDFIPLSEEEFNLLDKIDRQKYKKIKKSYKFWQKALNATNTKDVIFYSNKALSYYELYPVIVNLMLLYDSIGDNQKALEYTNKLLSTGELKDKYYYKYYAKQNLSLGNFSEAILGANNYIKLSNINNEDKAYCYRIIGLANFKLKNYQKAIDYANKAIVLDKTQEKYALEILYMSYFELKNFINANKYAFKLYSYSFPDKFSASMRIATTSASIDTKLKFYDIAKQNTNEEFKINMINGFIAEIYEKKLDIAIKNINGFVNRPSWIDIEKRDNHLMSFQIKNQRFETYHNKLKQGLSKYKGNDLKNFLLSLKSDEEKFSQRLFDEYQEMNRQIAEEERLRQLRIMNANMQYSNYLQQQQNYILNRPRYTNTTIRPIGNTYYMNSYSY